MIAATDMEDRVEALIQRGKDVVKKQVQLHVDGLKKDIRIALKDAGSARDRPIPARPLAR